MEPTNIRQQLSETEAVKSPTLEALCHDLDLFINELSLGNNVKPNSIQLNHDNLSVSVVPLPFLLFFSLKNVLTEL